MVNHNIQNGVVHDLQSVAQDLCYVSIDAMLSQLGRQNILLDEHGHVVGITEAGYYEAACASSTQSGAFLRYVVCNSLLPKIMHDQKLFDLIMNNGVVKEPPKEKSKSMKPVRDNVKVINTRKNKGKKKGE